MGNLAAIEMLYICMRVLLKVTDDTEQMITIHY